MWKETVFLIFLFDTKGFSSSNLPEQGSLMKRPADSTMSTTSEQTKLRVDRRVLRMDRRMDRRVLRVDRWVLRVEKLVLRVGKRVLRVQRVVKRVLLVTRLVVCKHYE